MFIGSNPYFFVFVSHLYNPTQPWLFSMAQSPSPSPGKPKNPGPGSMRKIGLELADGAGNIMELWLDDFPASHV